MEYIKLGCEYFIRERSALMKRGDKRLFGQGLSKISRDQMSSDSTEVNELGYSWSNLSWI